MKSGANVFGQPADEVQGVFVVRLTRVTGIVLIVLGAVYFVMTGSTHPTALIPSAFGLLLLLCGVLANSEDPKRVMLWMHIAVTIGLLGFLSTALRGGKAYAHAATLTIVQRTAAQEELIMAVACLVFTALCVRNFVANRRARLA